MELTIKGSDTLSCSFVKGEWFYLEKISTEHNYSTKKAESVKEVLNRTIKNPIKDKRQPHFLIYTDRNFMIRLICEVLYP
jgi:hypothetical protein